MSMWIGIKRVVRNGVIGFLRNGFVSLASIFIISITLFSIVGVIFTNAALKAVLEQLEQKVDINIYFVPDAPESEIQKLKATLEKQPEVAEVIYMSKDEALARFRERHKDDPATLKALDELDSNPLGASLAIRAKEIGQYESIAKFLEGKTELEANQTPLIEHINFFKNKPVIDRLIEISKSAKRLGIALAVILVFASFVIVFNTIRLAIFSAKDEISVMKLVGASNWYARGPFVIEASLYGFVSGLLVYAISYPIAVWLGPASYRFFGNFSTEMFFEEHALWLFVVTVGSGVLLGAISSYFAARRYLKV